MIVVNLFKEIAQRTADKLEMHVNFMHGHHSEITQVLTDLTQDIDASAGKYPLIALFQDFEEKKGNYFIELPAIQIIIATLTDKNYLAAERYDKTFIPVLYPIYNEFIRQIAISTYFKESSVNKIAHTKIDRLFWGKNGLYGNTGNVFNDFIDAIEIKNLNLNVKLNTC